MTRWYLGSAALALAGLCCLLLDVPLSFWIRDGNSPDLLEKLAGLSEIFGHGLGIVMIVITIAVLDPVHRVAIPRILAASLGAGLVANLFKLLIARWRPNHVDFSVVDRGIDTFAGWFPLGMNTSGQQGFPSSHMATAAGLAIVLSAVYPRGRWLFPVCAALAGTQRLLHQAHFLSDVLWGAAVGCTIAPMFCGKTRFAKAFDRLEAWLRERDPGAAFPIPRPHVPLSPRASRSVDLADRQRIS